MNDRLELFLWIALFFFIADLAVGIFLAEIVLAYKGLLLLLLACVGAALGKLLSLCSQKTSKESEEDNG